MCRIFPWLDAGKNKKKRKSLRREEKCESANKKKEFEGPDRRGEVRRTEGEVEGDQRPRGKKKRGG